MITILTLTGCSTDTATQEVKLISSEDYPNFKTASILDFAGENRFDINVISWEFVNEHMILIKGERQTTRDGKITNITQYDFLVDKDNVVFNTSLQVELD